MTNRLVEATEDAARMDKRGFEDEIKRGAIDLHQRYFGIGPSRIRVEIVKSVIILDQEQCFTQLEKTLLKHRRTAEVVRMREQLMRQWLDDEANQSSFGFKVMDAFVKVYPHEDRVIYFIVGEEDITW